MEIRSLDNPDVRLSVFEDEQGDIYVSIRHIGKTTRETRTLDVRIGGAASGHEVPRRLHHFLHEVAHEFGRFTGIAFENEAARIGDREDELKEINYQIAALEDMLSKTDSIIMVTSLRHRLEKLYWEKENLSKK